MTAKTKKRTSAKVSSVSPTVRNSSGLREVLFDEIDMIRAGVSTPARANAVAKLTSGLIDTVRMDIEIQKHESASNISSRPKVEKIEDMPSLSHNLA